MTPTIEWHWRKIAGNRWVATRVDVWALDQQRELLRLMQPAPWPPDWWLRESGPFQYAGMNTQSQAALTRSAQDFYQRYPL